MRRISVKLVLLWATAAASLVWGQPTISTIVPASVPAGSSATTLTVNGSNFVFVPNSASYSTINLDGAAVATTFVNSGTLTTTVPASMLISPAQHSVQVANPATPGAGAMFSNTVTFSVLAPTITSLSTSSIPAGSPAFSLTVTGANFLAGSQVSFRGTGLASTFVNSTTLTTTVPSNLVATAGQVNVQVFNPGGSSSGTLPFVVGPPALTISPASNVPGGGVGVAYTGLIVATGGSAPYTFSVSGGTLPDGLTLASGGALSGTPRTPGQFAFSVLVTDSKGATAGGEFSITIQPAPLNITGGPTGPVPAGTPINITFAATGGVPPYHFSATGIPPGTAFNNGVLSGTPTTVGAYTIHVTVTDSATGVFSKDFALTVTQAPPPLILGGTLSDGKVGVPYTGQITATGGVAPYSYSGSGLPAGLSLSATGGISGTPTTPGQFTLAATVTDSKGATASGRFAFAIAPAALAITTASAPNGTVGTAYSASFAASGGIAPYTFSAAGLPPGLSMSAAGAISGTPTAPGAATIVVTVKDSSGASTSKSFAVTIVMPPAPPLTFNIAGVSGTAGPMQQPRVQVSLGSPYPVDVVTTLTLTFAPDSGADDPSIQFSSGGRTARITIPAGATNGATDVGVQTGSVAGLITITAQLQAAGQDITPSPAPLRTIRIAAAAPVIVTGTLTAVRNSTGFTVTLTGYATDRELTQGAFVFAAAAGSNLQTATLTVPLGPLFAAYYSGAAAAPYGSQFTYTQPFTVTGNSQTIVSVTVTLGNAIGQSTAVTATLN